VCFLCCFSRSSESACRNLEVMQPWCRGVSAEFLENGAVSTGRCNTGLQFTRRSIKAQGFSRALIEAQSDLVEPGLRVDGQVGLLREVLSQ